MHAFRFAVRYLLRHPGIPSVAVLSLALGMMATTAIYSVVHAVVLDPFPYKDVDRLTSVAVWNADGPGRRMGYSKDQFLEIAERSAIFDGVIASTISDVLWSNGAEPQRIRGNYGTPNTFAVMGVPPLVGRAFGPPDATADAPPVVVLGYRFWQRQFDGDPGVIGRELRLNDKVRTVVGVMPKRFMWRGADVYLPVALTRAEVIEGVTTVHLLGRLKPNITEARASTDLSPIIEDLKRREPAQFPERWRVGLVSFEETFPSGIRDNLWILFGAVGLLLLIACANASNLLLSNATARQKEMTVRAALGAGRGGIVGQLLVESLVIACVAGALGIILASGALEAIMALVPPDTIPDESDVALNMPVLWFTLAVSAATSVIFGLAPALHATSADMVTSLRASGRGVTSGRRHRFFRHALVVAEVAVSLMLLVGAGLMIRTYLALERVDLGFRTDRVLTVRVPLPDRRYPDRDKRAAFFQELIQRVQAVPGVESVGVNLGAHPFGSMNTPVEVVGGGQAAVPSALVHQVNPGYLRTLGIGLSDGRVFDDGDVDGRRPLAIVNRSFVRTRLDGRPPIGQVVRIPALKQPFFNSSTDTFEIIGVVGDTVNQGLTNEVTAEVYVPYTLTGRADRLVVLARVSPVDITKATLAQVYAIDREQPATEVLTMTAALQDFEYAQPRFNLVLFSVFATLGLVLTTIGVYGVMSNAVAQQTHEMGVRMAIGASPGSVFRMVVGRGARLMGAGIALGLVGSLLAGRVLESYVWRVSTFDPLTSAVVSSVLMVVGLQACLWPARRAARINPIVALGAD